MRGAPRFETIHVASEDEALHRLMLFGLPPRTDAF